MNDLVRAFDYGGGELRAVVIDNEPWFCLADLGRALDLNNVRDFTRSVACDKEGVKKLPARGVENFHTPERGAQEMLFISEPNLYALVLRSNKPEAISFQRWVTKEVLPSIRKTGSYAAAPVSSDPVLAQLEALTTVRREQIAMAEQVSGLDERLKALESRPKLAPIDPGAPSVRRVKMMVSHLAILSGNEAQDVYRQAYALLEHEMGVVLIDEKKKVRARSLLRTVEAQGWIPQLLSILDDMAREWSR